MIVFKANEQPDSFKYQQTSLTFHVIGFRGSIGGEIEYCVDRISDEDCWTSIFGIDTLEDELKSLKDWDTGNGRRFFLFEDKIFNVKDDGDRERFFFGIRERFDSK